METKKLGYLLLLIAIVLIVVIGITKFLSKDDHEIKLTALDNQSVELIKKSSELKRNMSTSISDLNTSKVTINRQIQQPNWNLQRNRDSLLIQTRNLQRNLNEFNNYTNQLESIENGIVDLQKEVLNLQEEKESDTNKSLGALGISAIVLIGCFYTLNKKNAKAADKEWSIRIITLIIGFWIGIEI